jgi:Fe-S cluster assembly iron-binding protein IscA
MKIIILLVFILSVQVSSAKDKCTFDFKEFHSLLNNKSKKFKSMKLEIKDETSKTITQQAKLKSGVNILFIGGGCNHFSYSFNYSKIKVKGKKIQDQFKKAHDLLVSTDVEKKYSNVLIEALDKMIKAPIKKSKTMVYDLSCGDALCSLDLSSNNSIKISYSLAL